MSAIPSASQAETVRKIRSVVFLLLGVGILLLKRSYDGPLAELVHAYAGNISISFALYFLFTNLQVTHKWRRVFPAAISLVTVESFEAFNGFGIMSNTYDPGDFIANAIGIAIAIGLDIATSRREAEKPEFHRPTS